MTETWILIILAAILGYYHLTKKKLIQDPKTMAETLREIRKEHERSLFKETAVTRPPNPQDPNQPLTLAESIRRKILEAEAAKKSD